VLIYDQIAEIGMSKLTLSGVVRVQKRDTTTRFDAYNSDFTPPTYDGVWRKQRVESRIVCIYTTRFASCVLK